MQGSADPGSTAILPLYGIRLAHLVLDDYFNPPGSDW